MSLIASILRANGLSFGQVVAQTGSGATSIDWTSSSKQRVTLTGNATLSFVAPIGVTTTTLFIQQDATGGRTITWPAGMKWSTGSAPTLSTGAGAVDMVTLLYDGTNYWSQFTANFLTVFGPAGICVDGDSISAGYGSGVEYSTLAAAEMQSGFGTMTNIAVSGETFATMLSNIPSNVVPVINAAISAKQIPMCSCFAGTNDIVASASASAVYTTATNYFETCKTDGAKYCFAWTILPRSGFAGFEATRLSFNSMLLAGYSSIEVDYVVNVGADPSLGNVNATSNGTLYLDGIHPTAFGDQILADYFAANLLQVGTGVSVTGISPGTGSIAGGTSVTITGKGFLGATVVNIGGLRAASFTVVDDGHITATTPAAYYAGAGPVIIIAPNGSGLLASGWTWT
jgi:hypothetical protein